MILDDINSIMISVHLSPGAQARSRDAFLQQLVEAPVGTEHTVYPSGIFA